MEHGFTYGLIGAAAITLLALWLSATTAIVKNISPGNTAPTYSFSRFQLMWWTVLIASTSWVAFCVLDHFATLSASMLVLLGISLATTTAGRIIDNKQIVTNAVRHQDLASQGFLFDILSDENGIAVHRFQALVFNLIYGIGFLVRFFQTVRGPNFVFMDFNEFELALMGISSSAFIALKMNENNGAVIPVSNTANGMASTTATANT